MPLFTVILPTFNRARLLERAIDSVLAQTFRDYELIVVDDGSTDETAALLAKHEDAVRVLRLNHAGVTSARNHGIREGRGEYVVFLDSDDLLFPWTLAELGRVVETCERPAFAIVNARHFRSEAELAGVAAEPLRVERWGDYLESGRVRRYRVYLGGAMVRSDVLAEVGGFFEVEGPICAEDHDLFLRMGTAPGFVYIEAPCLYAYREHAGNTIKDTRALYAGMRMLLERERAGVYAGGETRRTERQVFLVRLLHYTLRHLFRQHSLRLGYGLYCRSLGFYLRSGRWRDWFKLPVLRGTLVGLKHWVAVVLGIFGS